MQPCEYNWTVHAVVMRPYVKLLWLRCIFYFTVAFSRFCEFECYLIGASAVIAWKSSSLVWSIYVAMLGRILCSTHLLRYSGTSWLHDVGGATEVKTVWQTGLLTTDILILSHGGHKPGILRDFSEYGKLVEFSGNSVQPQGKIITNKIVLVRWNICVKQLLTG